MKKILLTIALFGVVLIGKSQTVMNELYSDPNVNAGKSEFFELYNSSTNPIAENLDCYTMVVYYKEGSGQNAVTGFYVLDFPNVSVGPHSYFIGAAASPFNVQSQTGVTADINWNSLDASGSLKFYQRSGNGYLAPTTPSNLTDFLRVNTGTSASLAVFLFKDGAYINGFLGGYNQSSVPSDITTMPLLPVTMSGCAGFNIDWSTISFAEQTTANGGSDNGYARSCDGVCGSWVKTSTSVNHTPGITNGTGTACASGSFTTAPEIIKCRVAPGTGRVIFSITSFSGDVSLAADFPFEVQVYVDYDATLTQGAGNGQLDQYDTIKGTRSLANINISDSVDFQPGRQPLIVVYKSKRGCFQKVVAVTNTCAPLPVNFTYFTAKRTTASSVYLSWQTSFELNNSGFAIERNIGGSWEQIAFVASQASAGNSDVAMSYSYVDVNSTKGITQYRIRQVDLNGKYYFTDIRAVRGIDQPGKTIVYPNPSFDGKVNVVFEDAVGIRDISLIDMSGRMIRQWNGVSNNNLQIDNLVPGFYSLRVVVRETGAQSVEKIVINKR